MRLRLFVLVAALLGSVLAPATAAQAAAPAVQITKVYYNSPGSDNRSNSSLNAEYVTLKNTTRGTLNLYRWTLRDKSNHVYTFTGTFYLGAGKSVTIHTGRGSNSAAHRYWGSRAYIWNNTGDAAYVRNASGKTIDSCSWGSKGSYTNC
ncbi:Lamin Tail Domain [Micromonospora pattaloongensis]|uniref:Lamin Tail Domain n=1 Tax=Micromonospora pattaloongensis TaxID=405436 RepID=A0A1H3HU71_9ACTN|nr:lamin tail domain-containing protein [Micromonospora pattaloongensis]SDY18972.1 Lamin Tail Domain [Micromonospora pattaloongensis]